MWFRHFSINVLLYIMKMVQNFSHSRVILILEQYNNFRFSICGAWFLAAEVVVLGYFVAWPWEAKSVATVSATVIHLSR